MLKSFKLFATIFVFLTFFSCTKSNKIIENVNNSKINNKVLTAGDFLNNAHDTLDQRVNYCLYGIALSLREDLLNNTIISDLISIADTNDGEVNVYNFLDNHLALKDSFNHRLAIITGNNPENFNYKNYIVSHLEYDTIYQPYITIINMGTLNQDLEPYVCVGAQIDENFWPLDEDNILQFAKVDGVWNINTIGESAATGTSNPVFVVNNGLPSTGVDIDKIAIDVSQKTNSTTNYYQDEIKLNYAYEKSGRIDYKIYTAYFSLDQFNNYYLNVLSSKEKIKRNKVGKSIALSFNITPFADAITISSCNTELINLEYDWYASKKVAGIICLTSSNITENLKGKMKYKYNWYHFNPEAVGFDFPLHLPNNGSQYTQSNIKGYIKLSRIYK